MRPLLFILISALGLISCSENSFARYRLKSGSLELIPNLNQAKNYRSSTDTLSLSLLLQGDYYQETNQASPIPSSEVNKVEVQVYTSVATTNPLSNIIEYRLESIPSRDQANGSYDRISVILVGENDRILASLLLENQDSIKCAAPDCRYADTLMIDSVNYFEVYYLAEDPQEPNIYINRSEGVVAFKNEQQVTYQRIK